MHFLFPRAQCLTMFSGYLLRIDVIGYSPDLELEKIYRKQKHLFQSPHPKKANLLYNKCICTQKKKGRLTSFASQSNLVSHPV